MTAPKTICPGPAELQGWLQGELPPDLHAELGRHVEACPACQNSLQGLVAGPGEWSAAAASLGAAAAVPTVALRNAITRLKETQGPAAAGGLLASICARLELTFFDPPAAPDELGRCGPYRVLEFVGRGAVGVVLKAHDARLGRSVALKFLAPALAGDEQAREQFLRAARAAAPIAHENVLPLYEVSVFKGFPYLAMPFIAGPSLQVRLERDGPLPWREVVRLGAQVAAALAAAHAGGLVHGDVRPANLLLDPATGQVRLTDFGLARAGAASPYAAPEQTRGEAGDRRADLYSLGAVLSALATGRPPRRDATAPTSDAALPAWFQAIVGRLLARNPADRFASAAEVAELLRARADEVSRPRPTPARPRPWGLILALAGAALMGAALALATLAALGWLHGPMPEVTAPAPAVEPTAPRTVPPDSKSGPLPAGRKMGGPGG